MNEMFWGPVDDAVCGAEQGRPVLIVEGNDDTGRGKLGQVLLALASGSREMNYISLF